ncbi:sugar lactone lactonase YvrE [Rhizomicrobium palustre]|uniref:Sugar lactone lactonase YvrE n=1 Tax=Rhizomicrobium palustre TaxID=189966 RepID=A0A846N0L4_9PROT|nr:SMP-30/gluconolactonase/LRE family protein [Rhizomicrobium palustre]NIK89103.1 sugar lactone lactonase YvrE [Rhizomicrobium palustre]
MQPQDRVRVANTLGECVLWDGRALWWTDIDSRVLYHLEWSSGRLRQIPTPARLASFGLIAGQREFVAAFDDGFALFDPETGLRGPLLVPEGLSPGLRMNDGRVDRQGRFWSGSMVMDPNGKSVAMLYSMGEAGLRRHADGIAISNGLAFSPEGDRMYFADSRRGMIWQYAVDAESGTLGKRSFFAEAQHGGEPDGACVDEDGCLWIAVWGASAVIRYTPEGRVDRVLEVPVRQPTCVTFGGPDLDLLFVTSASLGLGPCETGAGDVLVYNVGVKGLAESRCNAEAWPNFA